MQEEVRLLLKQAKEIREQSYRLEVRQKGFEQTAAYFEKSKLKWQGKTIVWENRKEGNTYYEILSTRIPAHRYLDAGCFDQDKLEDDFLLVDVVLLKLEAENKVKDSILFNRLREEYAQKAYSGLTYRKPFCDLIREVKVAHYFQWNFSGSVHELLTRLRSEKRKR